MKYVKKFFLLFVVFMPLISCDEEDAFVDKKPNVTLLSPSDKTSGVDIAPSFEWQGSDPTGKELTYDFYLGLDSTKLFIEAKGLKESNYKLADYKLRKDVTFYWKVVVSNGIQENESDIWSFMSIPAPAAPNLVAPEANVFIRESLVLEWEAVPAGEGETISYNVYLGKDKNPKELVGTVDDGSTSLTIDASPLEVGANYYWRVDATDLINSSSSEVRTFKKLALGSPDEPMLVAPLDRTGVPSGVVLDWTDVPDPEGDLVSYDVYMDKSNTPTTLVSSSNASQFTTSNLDVNAAYYWYIIAKDPAGNSTKSKTYGFSVTGVGVGFPNIHNFEVEDMLSLDEKLVWDSASGATSYDVYVGTSNPPVNKIASDITETEFQIKNADIPSDITDVKTYYALVVAKDGTGGETNSFPVAFTPQMTGTVTDVRGGVSEDYTWVRIGTSIWMSQNLRTKKLSNGDDLSLIINDNLGLATDMYYDEHPENLPGFTPNWSEVHGRVYCSALVANSQMAPEGWHVMETEDYKYLESYGTKKTGDFMGKWHDGGLDTYGLNLVTAGYRYESKSKFENGFRTSLEKSRLEIWVNDGIPSVWELNNSYNKKFRIFNNQANKMFAIRLVKDE
ncbi:FISUMP domain-containing protein [Mariniflexile sp. AS56]|uniref:FISUMP domain-containing protein n=1 Tax=Mariniflexile sp. AS56 TaxID=3063957 RepID=UPI0026EED334|nr:FISUMP domain-containing protein [Mariniflexile sp. AS56]MDO7172503.1 FISUMP domain-containing protein [Mariniflexile sp. AS56]